MKIQTKFHGEVQLDTENIYTFQQGMPGFLNEKKFILLELDDSPFYVLQSITKAAVAFILVDPFKVYSNYEVKLSDEVLEELQIQSEQDVALFVILSVKEPFETSTANLIAPVILNQTKKMGKQHILKSELYHTQHALFEPPVEQEVK